MIDLGLIHIILILIILAVQC